MDIKKTMLLALTVAAAGVSAQASIIQFNAESGNVESNFDFVSNSDALGGTVIETIASGNYGPQDIASYEVNFTQAGDYDLYMRWAVAPSGSQDSFFVGTQFGQLSSAPTDFPGSDKAELNGLQIDGGGAHEARNAAVVDGGVYSDYTPGDFVWVDLTSNWRENVTGAGNMEVPVFNVSAPGTLTWQAGGREGGFQVDAFAFVTSGRQVAVDGSGNLFERAIVNWTGGPTGDYGTAANWDSGAVPGQNDIVHINNGAGAVTLGQSASVWELGLGTATGESGSLAVGPNQTLTISNGVFLGRDGGTGTITVNDAAALNITARDLSVGNNTSAAGAAGHVILNGSAKLNESGQTVLGDGAGTTGTVVMNGTSSFTAGDWVSVGRGGDGTLTLNDTAAFSETGGSMVIASPHGGGAGNGTVNVTGNATVNISGETRLGNADGAIGVLNMSGHSTWVTDNSFSIARIDSDTTGKLVMKDYASLTKTGPNHFNVGDHGNGSAYLYDNAQVHDTVGTRVGNASGSVGLLEMNGNSQWTADRWADFSNGGQATVTMNDQSKFIAGANPQSGDTPQLVVGDSGTGTLTMNTGAQVEVENGGEASIGRDGGTGNLYLNNSSTFTVDDGGFYVGRNGGSGDVTTGVVEVNDDAAITAKGVYVGAGGAGNGTVTQSGGTVNAGDVLMVTSGANEGNDTNGPASASTVGKYFLNGGVLTAGYVGASLAGNADFEFNGGTLQANSDQSDFFRLTGDQSVIQSGGATIDSNGYNVAINQTLGGSGGLTKTGQGSLTFSAPQAFLGAVHVTAGTLTLHGTSSRAESNAATVDDGATLAGDGYFASLASSGDVAPDSASMDVAGDFSLSGAGASMSADVTSKDTYGHLTAGGAATVTGILNLTATDPTQLSLGDIMTLLSAGNGVTGTFGQVTGISLGQIAGFNDALAVLYGTNDVTARVSIVGDANTDDVVNGLDLQLIANNWQGTGDTWIQGDFNGDGLVNGLDLQLLANNWQAGVGGTSQSFAQAMALYGPGTSSVPEPASAALLLAMLGMIGLRRRHRAAHAA